jgi:hypothetical protein
MAIDATWVRNLFGSPAAFAAEREFQRLSRLTERCMLLNPASVAQAYRIARTTTLSADEVFAGLERLRIDRHGARVRDEDFIEAHDDFMRAGYYPDAHKCARAAAERSKDLDAFGRELWS